MKRKDGSILHILWNSVIIYDDNKKYNGHYSMGLDLTEMDELRNKLIKNERFVAIGELSSRIAHDIKNPLTALQNSVKIIEIKTGGDNELINKEIQRMNKAIKRIVHQVDQVLNFVKITPFNVKKNQLLEILNSSLESITITKNITVTIPKNDYTIVCDEMKIGVVFYNLFLNAVQAIGSDNGTITIRMSEEQNNIKLEFENSGVGIDKENLGKIFEPLFTTKMEGTGLGLSSCKTIIQEHRGIISVSSNPVIFTILLPKTQ
jgi:signal transduction histidine kinase